MKKMLLLAVMIIVAMAFAITPAMAVELVGQNGSASVSSQVGGMVISGNVTVNGFGGSYASQTAVNHSVAGFNTSKCGNTVTSTAFGNTTGYTYGIAINGIAIGFQGGSFAAQASRNTGRR